MTELEPATLVAQTDYETRQFRATVLALLWGLMAHVAIWYWFAVLCGIVAVVHFGSIAVRALGQALIERAAK